MLTRGITRVCSAARRQIPLLSGTVSRGKAGYEGDGKTTVKVLNQDDELGLMIDCYATYGFRLNNGITVLGPMAIFPRTVLSWQVRGSPEITPESLQLFKVLDPKVDLLVVGVETSDREAIDGVFRAARAVGVNVEILPTERACPTFNFLNAEGRCVAAALIPPLTVTVSEDDMLGSRLHYDNIYKKQI